MSEAVRQLEPSSLWNHFADLNAVPRPSKKEERVIAFMMDFGEKLGLATMKDHIGNVIIKKPATDGMENRKTVVLQSHLDMVHQKNADVDFDFLTEGIKMLVDKDWVKADGTTLGADNGLGVASIMAVLSSDDIAHPAIEALFTIDEETGMTGALELKGGLLDGQILLNLDTEDDDELTIGCAGGIDITATSSYQERVLPDGYAFRKLVVRGLSGGHSGMDIHKGLGNANKIMNRLLTEISKKCEIKVNRIDGGGLRNAIPRESVAEFAIDSIDDEHLKTIVSEQSHFISAEHGTTDPELRIELLDGETFEKYVDQARMKQFLKAIYACPNGIYRMSPDIDDLVQTSNNLARVIIENGSFKVLCLTRSSVDTEKQDLMHAISAVFQLIDTDVNYSGNYPGWTPRPKAPIIGIMKKLYEDIFKTDIHAVACHAGLECGILGTNYPEMEMISFGPNIRGAHSPDERVQISSVQKFWNYLIAVLREIPEK